MAGCLVFWHAAWSTVTALTCGGFGVDESTLIARDASGNAKVYGTGKADFLKPNAYPERVQGGVSVIWNNGGQAVSVYAITGSRTGAGSFNLGSWSGSSGVAKRWYTSGSYSGFNCQRGC